LVLPLRFSFVPKFVRVTSVLGMAAPEESVTFPTTEPKVVCARVSGEESRRREVRATAGEYKLCIFLNMTTPWLTDLYYKLVA
jgi:hypothetical protein